MWVNVPVRYIKEGQPDYKELGIDVKPEYEPGDMLINMDFVNSINASDDGEETILRFNGISGDNCIWVQMKFDEFVKILTK